MAVIELNQANFEQTVLNNDFVIIESGPPAAAPAAVFPPFTRQPRTSMRTCEGQYGRGAACPLPDRVIPTLMIFREKVIIHAQHGALPASALGDLIARASEVDMAKVDQELTKQQAA